MRLDGTFQAFDRRHQLIGDGYPSAQEATQAVVRRAWAAS
jgi:hypothetical protein